MEKTFGLTMAGRETEDPFGMFGDDDDDDDNEDDQHRHVPSDAQASIHMAARSGAGKASNLTDPTGGLDGTTSTAHNVPAAAAALGEASDSNATTGMYRNNSQQRHEDGLLPPSPVRMDNNTATAATSENLVEVQLPWPRPLYVGPMKVVSSSHMDRFGGGRGCVAERDLPPGTLVLVEDPIATWDERRQQLLHQQQQQGEEEDFDLMGALVDLLHHNAEVEAILHAMEHLHPTKTTVDNGVRLKAHKGMDGAQVSQMLIVQKQVEDDDRFQPCLDIAQTKGLCNRDGTPVTVKDICRIVLALRYNALASGLFLYSAMFNHADHPNCVKFIPHPPKSYSEVRTTRHVHAGEVLTISYLSRLLSHAARRKYLWEQHRFDIGADVVTSTFGSGLREMELIGSEFPPSSLDWYDPDSTTARIEKTVLDLEGLVRVPSITAVYSLEQTALELYTESVHQLRNDKHVLLIPCLQIHIDCCYQVLRDPSLPAAARVQLLLRMIVSARRLLALQGAWYGPDHFDLARTQHDIAQAVDEALAKAPRVLVNLDLAGLSSISAWSSVEYAARQEHARIKALYPEDTDEYISIQQS